MIEVLSLPKRRYWIFGLLLALFDVLPVAVHAKPTPSAVIKELWAKSIVSELAQNFQAAILVLEPVKDDSAWAARINARLGWLYLQDRKMQSSYLAYRRALVADAKYVDALTGILLPLAEMNRWQEVSARSQDLTQKYPSLYQAHYYLCLSALVRREWRSAIEYADEALQYYALSADFMVFRARALDALGEVDSAIEQYGVVLAVAPKNLEAIRYLRIYDPSFAVQ